MEFSLYIQTSEVNAVRKNLLSAQTFEGNILGETSLINPTFLIKGSSLALYNYLYCKDFNRYYFIDDIAVVRTGLWRVRCSVDVLMSYADYITSLECIIDKQEAQFKSNQFLNDGSFVADQRIGIEMVKFPNGFLDEGIFVMVTLGPGGVTNG